MISGLFVQTEIRAITFDVGGTLIEPWPSVGAVYGAVARELGFGNFAAERLTDQFICGWKARGEFGYSKAEWRVLVECSFHGLCTVSDHLFDAIYERFGRADAWRVFEDAIPALESLRRSGIRLGIISNWDERLRPLLSELRLIEKFDSIIISSEVGAHKPDARIFRAAAEALQLDPREILHIGDSFAEDLHGARSAGFQALQLKREFERARDHIQSLSELPSIIAAQS
jgi:putative hydrolase of the HAD superfamily